jgi:hypothetical protein
MQTDELTAEQKKDINKLEVKHFVDSILLGVSSAVTLVLLNIVIVLSVKLLEMPEPVDFAANVFVAILVFRRMLLISKESHDRLIQELKKITDQK